MNEAEGHQLLGRCAERTSTVMRTLILVCLIFLTESALAACPRAKWLPFPVPETDATGVGVALAGSDLPSSKAPWETINGWTAGGLIASTRIVADADDPKIAWQAVIEMSRRGKGASWTSEVWRGPLTAGPDGPAKVYSIKEVDVTGDGKPEVVVGYVVNGDSEPVIGSPVDGWVAIHDGATGHQLWNHRLSHAYWVDGEADCSSKVTMADFGCDGGQVLDVTYECADSKGGPETRSVWRQDAVGKPWKEVAKSKLKKTSGKYLVIAGSYRMFSKKGTQSAEAKRKKLVEAGFKRAKTHPSVAYKSLACCFWSVIAQQTSDRDTAKQTLARMKEQGFKGYVKRLK